MLSPADTSYVRIKIIKRFGESWLYMALFICAYIIRNEYPDYVDYPDDCNVGLVRFLNAYFYGYCFYVSFLFVTLVGCVIPKLETTFRIINAIFFAVYFFGLFIYANYVIHALSESTTCKTQNLEMKLFTIIYIISWYAYLATRVVMFVLYIAKKTFTGRQHELEGVSLFVDAE